METFAQLRTCLEHGVASATERRRSGFSHRGAASRAQHIPATEPPPRGTQVCGIHEHTGESIGVEPPEKGVRLVLDHIEMPRTGKP